MREKEPGEERGDVHPAEPSEPADRPGGYRVDLPQYAAAETQKPKVVAPLPELPRDRGLRGRVKALAKDWRVKGTLQRVLGRMPGGAYMHYQLQRRFGGLRDFGRECDIKVDDWRLMMGHLANAGVDITRSTLMEMGTGWYPTFPTALYLAGARRVETVDVERLLKPELAIAMVERLGIHVSTIANVAGAEDAAVRARHAELLAALRAGATIGAATDGAINYRAPSDASKTGLDDDSIDVVFSNSVLEHVPGGIIEACFVEAMRILRPGGIVFHSVNCGDHYAYTDPSIDQLHYLGYSNEAWEKWNNAFLYQNRLRAIDFTTMCVRAGFAIVLDTSRPHPKRLEQLENIDVHPVFAKYAREQLAITSIDFIGRKPRASDN